MNSKTTKAIYWTGASLMSLWFGASGFCELTHILSYGTLPSNWTCLIAVKWVGKLFVVNCCAWAVCVATNRLTIGNMTISAESERPGVLIWVFIILGFVFVFK